MNVNFLIGGFLKECSMEHPECSVYLCGKYFSFSDYYVDGSFSPIIGSISGDADYSYVVDFVRKNLPDGSYFVDGDLSNILTKGYFVACNPLKRGEMPISGIVGIWTNGDEKLIEESFYFLGYKEAIRFAKENNQTYIWGIEECTAIKV